ncbi:RnfABCDGE type electron transport complex subunit B [Anaerovorax odorimutans]|uniref:RnfABCDGE type electron transport complex subunit B n=1 Tax=Anaerovorax odorimutans TaxID=109327 RepID=UPI00040CBC48|nr:RnfABCDGE type electron transport complex subunit B [Anaerovorax odorimutans]
MQQYFLPIIIVIIIGFLAGTILTLASKFMAVKVNETVVKVKEILPGANCGACGYAGCEDYAVALANDPTIKPNLCTPGGSSVALAISNALGIEFEAVAGKTAVVKCSGTYAKTNYVMDYRGLQSCAANKMFYRGRGACDYSCIGYGDCVDACEYDAIKIEGGVAVVDNDKCVGCGLCAKRCPNNLIDIVPGSNFVYVGCSSNEKGAVTKDKCTIGCIGCKKCEKICKFDAIHVINNLAVIDYDKCKNCKMCINECPVGVIKFNN